MRGLYHRVRSTTLNLHDWQFPQIGGTVCGRPYVIRALLFGVYVRAPDFLETPEHFRPQVSAKLGGWKARESGSALQIRTKPGPNSNCTYNHHSIDPLHAAT